MKNFFKKISLFFTFIFVFTGLFNFQLPNTVEAYCSKDNKSEISSDFQNVVDYIAKNNKLPNNYITKIEAMKLGWESGKDLWNYAPGRKIGGNIFYNFNGLLPEANGRIWRECDINYSHNSRGVERIVYSNDGLIYKTSDHYKSFTCCNPKEKKYN